VGPQGGPSDPTYRAVALEVGYRPPEPDPEPEPEPEAEPEGRNRCGPDITDALESALSAAAMHFRSLSWFQKRRSCMALDVDAPFAFVNPIMAWDVAQLFLPNTYWTDRFFSRHGCGSPRDPGCPGGRDLCETAGTCGNSVEVGGKCMLAGTANYALYGKMFRLCNDEFSPDFPRWDMIAMIAAYKALTLSFDDIGPPTAMAKAGFDGTFPSSSGADNRSFCTGRCPAAYSSPFTIIWEPYHSR